MLTDPDLRSSICFTIILTVDRGAGQPGAGAGAGAAAGPPFRGRGIVRTLLITPFLVVPVASALLWKHALLNPVYGLFNGTLTGIWKLFGADSAPQPDWLTEHPRLSVEIVAGLAVDAVHDADPAGRPAEPPGDAIEAAQMDGASPWQMFRYLTLPHLRQYLELGGLLGSIYIVQNFDAVFTITSGGLGTANLPYTIYQTFFQAHDYGQASAPGVVVVIGSIVIATFALRIVSSLFEEEADDRGDDARRPARATVEPTAPTAAAHPAAAGLRWPGSSCCCSSCRCSGWC